MFSMASRKKLYRFWYNSFVLPSAYRFSFQRSQFVLQSWRCVASDRALNNKRPLVETMEALESTGVKIDEKVCSKALERLLAHESKVGKAIRLAKEMLSKGFSPEPRTYVQLVRAAAPRFLDQAVYLKEQMRSKNMPALPEVYEVIINEFKNRNFNDMVINLFHEMDQYGIAATRGTINTLLLVFVQVSPANIESLLKYIKKYNIVPDREISNTAIHNATTQNFKLGTLLLREMKQLGLQPDANSYYSILHPLLKFRNIKLAEKYWDEMNAEGTVSDSKICTKFIEYYCQAKDIAKALQIVQYMTQNNIEPTQDTFMSFIESYIKMGNIDIPKAIVRNPSLDQLLVVCSEGGNNPNENIVDDNINSNDIDSSDSVSLDYNMHKDFPHDSSNSNNKNRCLQFVLVDALLNKHYLAEASALMANLDASGVEVWSDEEKQMFFNILDKFVIEIAHKKDYHTSLNIIEKFKLSLGYKPSVLAYNFVMKGLLKSDELNLIFKVYSMLKEDGRQIEPFVYNSVLSALGRQQRLAEIDLLLTDMKRNNILPDMVGFTSLLQLWHKQNNSAEILGCLTTMSKSKVQIDKKLFEIIFKCLLFLQQYSVMGTKSEYEALATHFITKYIESDIGYDKNIAFYISKTLPQESLQSIKNFKTLMHQKLNDKMERAASYGDLE